VKHPSADQLAAFGLGKLLGPSADTVVAHLETCVDCRQAVANISADSFVGRIQVADAGAAPSAVPPELANHPDYCIVRELGRGGMGVVYLARNTIMDREEVLKVAHRALLEKPGASDRFLQEIRSAAQLMHVNVVRAYSVLRLGDLLVFAMEYVPGDDLAKIVRKQGALPVAHACFYAAQVALGLQHAHERGMVHRDIKPSNLILSKDGKKPVVKILDFGLAKMTSEVGFARDLTGSNKMLGTPDYIAPEQILDAAKADIRADIYSLGCTLYYLLAGSPPFAGGSLYEVLHAHSTATAKPLNLVRPEVLAELEAVVAKMMAKEPRKRYQTPGEIAKDLQLFTKPGAAPVTSGTPGRPETPTGKSPRATAKTQEPIAAPKMPRNKAAESDPFAFAPKTMLGKSPAKPTRDRRPLWYGLAIALAIGFVGLTVLVAGVLRVQAPEGTIVVDVTPGDVDLRVDVDRVTVPTEKGEPIEIRRQPGSHKLEVGAKGFKIYSQDVAIELGGPKKLHVRLEPLEPLAANDKANRDKTEPIEKAKNANAEPKTPLPAAPVAFDDALKPKSIWVNDAQKIVFTVTERKDESFFAKFEIGANIESLVNGSVKDGKVSWSAKDVICVRGRTAGDNQGIIGSDKDGQKIDFAWQGPKGTTGTYTLRLSKESVSPNQMPNPAETKVEAAPPLPPVIKVVVPEPPKLRAEDLLVAGAYAEGTIGWPSRSKKQRAELLQKGGGTKESEEAVAKGLAWIAHQQFADGRFKFVDGNQGDLAATSFAVLPFLGAGMSHKKASPESIAAQIGRALKFIFQKQDLRGAFLKNARDPKSVDMYEQALCTLSLCEAYGLTRDPTIRHPAQRGIDFIVSAQHSEGGWRYQPGQPGDLDVSTWQFQALMAGTRVGLDVPARTLRSLESFLDRKLDRDTEGYGYITDQATPSNTAKGLYIRAYLQGWTSEKDRFQKGVAGYIEPSWPKPGLKDVIYYYYATEFMHRFGGGPWEKWNPRMREVLIDRQDRSGGSDAGSWSPAGDTWGRTGGRMMQTSLSLLILEVYYRNSSLVGGAADQEKK
jgi:serine/threonine protein kinase